MVITMEKIGLQLYSIRNHFNTPEEISDTFKKLKALGYDQAEMAGSHGLSYDRFYELAKEQGIEIIGTHDNFQEMCTDIDGMIAKHKQLHVKNMGIGGLFLYDENAVNGIPVEKVEKFIEDANKVADRIYEEGMKFVYHNHSHEFCVLSNGKRMIDMLIEGLDPVKTSFELDTCWVQNAGGNVESWIEKLAGRVDILHLKDMKYVIEKGADGKPNGHNIMTEIGSGNMDFFKIIEAARKTGVKYYIVEQDMCPEDFEPYLRLSSDYLHQNFMK